MRAKRVWSLRVRLTAAERKQYKKQAKKHEMTLSQWFRYLANLDVITKTGGIDL